MKLKNKMELKIKWIFTVELEIEFREWFLACPKFDEGSPKAVDVRFLPIIVGADDFRGLLEKMENEMENEIGTRKKWIADWFYKIHR